MKEKSCCQKSKQNITSLAWWPKDQLTSSADSSDRGPISCEKQKYVRFSGKNLFLACHDAIMRLNAICIKNTSAESTPVDRRLGFFFLCTAVRPVVGDPGVSLSREQLKFIPNCTRQFLKWSRMQKNFFSVHAPLCRNSLCSTQR